MSETTAAPAVAPHTLETETCSRCGGSGNFSYCQRYGTMCFKCGGKKIVLTKRGAAAAAHLTTLRSKRGDALDAGDKVWMGGVPGFIAGGWITVQSMGHYDTRGNHSYVGGVEIPQRTDLLTLSGTDKAGEGVSWHGIAPEQMLRVQQTPEQKRDTFLAALAYQDTLTKTGKPRATKRTG